jgi:hypothetical protein
MLPCWMLYSMWEGLQGVGFPMGASSNPGDSGAMQILHRARIPGGALQVGWLLCMEGLCHGAATSSLLLWC